MNRIALAAACISMSLAANLVQAGRENGGGSRVFVRGKWELADAFIAPQTPGEPMPLTKEMRDYLTAVQELMGTYGFENAEFWKKHVFANDVDIRFVATEKDLPCQDDPLVLPPPAPAQDTYGCTDEEMVTYLIRSKFEQFEFKNKAFAIVHERLHAFAPQIKHAPIAWFVYAGKYLVDLKERELAGETNFVPVKDRKTFALAQAQAEFLGFKPSWRPGFATAPVITLWHNGGGASVGTNNIDELSYIGVGSMIVRGFGAYDSGSYVKNSKVMDSKVIGASVTNTIVTDSTMEFGTLENSQIVDSEINRSDVYSSTANKSQIKNSADIYRSSLNEGAMIEDSMILDSTLSGTKVKESYLGLTLAGKSTISNAWIYSKPGQYREQEQPSGIGAQKPPRLIVSDGATLQGKAGVSRGYFKANDGKDFIVHEDRTVGTLPQFIIAPNTKVSFHEYQLPSGSKWARVRLRGNPTGTLTFDKRNGWFLPFMLAGLSTDKDKWSTELTVKPQVTSVTVSEPADLRAHVDLLTYPKVSFMECEDWEDHWGRECATR